MPNKVPRQRKPRQCFDLGKRLLQPILTDISDATVDSLRNILERDCFCDGDQFDRCGITPAGRGRLSDSVQYSKAVLSDIAHRALRVRGGFAGRLSPVTSVSSLPTVWRQAFAS